ncbi:MULTISPECIES: hypothetical protein [Streptomyces]|uniref:Uncharacterized protein n=1 Tax=Streptomyces siderophoricus TaxID=2802281 RepID=A0ABS1MMI0_9ACTN|nr:hypothetical protein [Streptomyces sp. 9-7]MBL1088982.1 hypothetical protein [Streptomyces sp. 9-7]
MRRLDSRMANIAENRQLKQQQDSIGEWISQIGDSRKPEKTQAAPSPNTEAL